MWQRRALYREVNERIADLADHLDLGESIPFLCECGTDGCNQRLELSRAEYERLRRFPTQFAVLPDHQSPAVERVIEDHERFSVVEKRGAAVASGSERRRRRTSGTGR